MHKLNDDMLQFIKKVQAVSQIGLSFSTDPYALENYEELKKISVGLLDRYTDLGEGNCDLFEQRAYPTPQPAVRTLTVREDGAILFVQEADSQLWSLPGGWCDVDSSPVENAVKETREESGFEVDCPRLLALFDRRNYLKKSLYDVYILYFLGRVKGGQAACNHETIQVGWFQPHELPPLSRKNSEAEIRIAYDVFINEKPAYFE